MLIAKVKESYRKKGLQEKQVTNLEALEKEIAEHEAYNEKIDILKADIQKHADAAQLENEIAED